MKKIGEYTVRGRVAPTTDSYRILLDDGKFDTGYKVVDFIVAPGDPNSSGQDLNAKLTTEPTTSLGWAWGNNLQIAWAASENRVTSSPVFGRSIVDPDNMVIQDIFLQCQNPGGGDVNYMIMLHKYDLTDSQGALAMVRNKSQGAD